MKPGAVSMATQIKLLLESKTKAKSKSIATQNGNQVLL